MSFGDAVMWVAGNAFWWMPESLAILCGGVLAIFVIYSVLKVIALILDVIPFL